MTTKLAEEIKRRIDNNEDVTVRNNVVTGVPCLYSYGYGKTKASVAEQVDATASNPVGKNREGSSPS